MSSSREPVSALPNPHPDAAWLALRSEPVLDPDLPIIDAHHHLWHGPHPRYLFDDILGDVGDGHTIEVTVFVEARSMYRENGPDELKPVGEVEYANGVAAVDKASFGYRVLWNAFKKVTASLDRADRAALFRDTAASFYGLSSLRTPERT